MMLVTDALEGEMLIKPPSSIPGAVLSVWTLHWTQTMKRGMQII